MTSTREPNAWKIDLKTKSIILNNVASGIEGLPNGTLCFVTCSAEILIIYTDVETKIETHLSKLPTKQSINKGLLTWDIGYKHGQYIYVFNKHGKDTVCFAEKFTTLDITQNIQNIECPCGTSLTTAIQKVSEFETMANKQVADVNKQLVQHEINVKELKEKHKAELDKVNATLAEKEKDLTATKIVQENVLAENKALKDRVVVVKESECPQPSLTIEQPYDVLDDAHEYIIILCVYNKSGWLNTTKQSLGFSDNTDNISLKDSVLYFKRGKKQELYQFVNSKFQGMKPEEAPVFFYTILRYADPHFTTLKMLRPSYQYTNTKPNENVLRICKCLYGINKCSLRSNPDLTTFYGKDFLNQQSYENIFEMMQGGTRKRLTRSEKEMLIEKCSLNQLYKLMYTNKLIDRGTIIKKLKSLKKLKV